MLRLSERILLDARRIAGSDDLLIAELWASEWLGEAWLAAPREETEPEHLICVDVAGRATAGPSVPGMAAVAALGRVAPEEERPMLAQAVDVLSAAHPAPPWSAAPGWLPAGAWHASDVWESERVLFVEYDGPRPHTLMALIAGDAGRLVARLEVLEPGAARLWGGSRDRAHEDDPESGRDGAREEDAVPMPLVPDAAEAVLGDLAAALRETDLAWPRLQEGGYPALRALAWSRARPYLPGWPDWNPSDDDARQALIGEFVAVSGLPGDEATRSLAELFLDYGDERIGPGPLAWSPGRVALFLGDYLPGRGPLDAAQRERLPEALRRWVRFALERRGVDPRWIGPVEEAVRIYLPATS
ncbi:hypothetical protein [Microtetraspora sp. NBRC 13810]|uniref:hypothetical protein n=1 Tax=Microtetraspora sp. NBRC 13810 TaxID=3030990 RepID=UPI002555C05A|nr:hypothetical protein [Microtetraspora sp. NBRC 13810]